MRSIKSHNDLKRIRSAVENYVRFLPGPLTPQKYNGPDSDAAVDDVYYGRVLTEIIEKFDNNWPLNNDRLDPVIKELTIVEGATVLILSESLTVLTDALKECKNQKKSRVISIILEDLVKSGAIFSAIVDACRYETEPFWKQKQVDQAWHSTIQILISLPSRVFNKMQFQTSKFFTRENYTKALCFHTYCAISFIIDGLCKCDIKPRIIGLTSLINKIVISLNPDDFTYFVDIFEGWCFENKRNERRFVESIFHELDTIRTAERIAILFLKHCDPKFGVCHIFGNVLNKSAWKYVFTSRIPISSYYENENVVVNLISYLSSFSNENNILTELLLDLLQIWSGDNFLKRSPTEQQIYITRLLILAVKACSDRLKEDEKKECEKLFFKGTRIRLECTDIILRAMGMITAEICMASLSNAENASKLKFEYDKMPANVLELVKSLENFNAHTLTIDLQEQYERSGDLIFENIIFDSPSSRKIYELGIDCGILSKPESPSAEDAESNVQQAHTSGATKNDPTKNETKQQERDSDDDDSILDSDDDAVPCDMSDDKPLSKVRPAYLRDLLYNLTNEQTLSDSDTFSESLLASEELILTQLPDDDVSFALELLLLFVTLRSESHVENFELIVLKCCVAIVTVRPTECAEYLCREFYEDVGKYSLRQRLLFLDILTESAKQLSKIDVGSTDSSNGADFDTAIKKKRIPSRISLFIDMEERKKKEVWINEDLDFGEETSENASVNWQEIVDKRIESRTKRFGPNVRKPPKMYVNHFANVLPSFFYPLMYGYGRRDKESRNSEFQGLKIFNDQDNILLLRFLKTLSALMRAAQNCPLAPKMAKEILDLTQSIGLRLHAEPTVRLAVTENIASILVAVPHDAIVKELFDELMEAREWLQDVQNIIRGEHDTNCRAMNAKVLSFIDMIFGSTLVKNRLN